MPAKETPVRRSARAPVTSKKNGQDSLTKEATGSRKTTPKTNRSELTTATGLSKAAVGAPPDSQGTVVGRETRRTSKRTAKDGNIQPGETAMKKLRRNTPKTMGSSVSHDTPMGTRSSSRRDPAAVKSNSPTSPLGGDIALPADGRPSTSTDASHIHADTTLEETRGGGDDTNKLPSPAKGKSQAADDAQPGPVSGRSRNTRSGAAKAASSANNSSQVEKKPPADTSGPTVIVGGTDTRSVASKVALPDKDLSPLADAGAPLVIAEEVEKELLVWQPLAMLPPTANVPMKKDSSTKMVEVNVRAEEAKKLSSKGPVNITPASEIYRALKAALEAQKSNSPGKNQSVQIALRVSTRIKQTSPATEQSTTVAKQLTSAIKKLSTASKQPSTGAKQLSPSKEQPRTLTERLISSTGQSDSAPTRPVVVAGNQPSKTTPAQSPRSPAGPKTKVKVDVIRPHLAKHTPVGLLAQSSQRGPESGDSSPVSILSASPYGSHSPLGLSKTSPAVPISKKRLRTAPTQTSEQDIELCRKVNTDSILTGYKVLTVSKDKVSRATLRTTVFARPRAVRKVAKKCQTEMRIEGLEAMILDRLQEGAKDEPLGANLASDRCSLQLMGNRDGAVDRRIQAMLFGQDLDMALTESGHSRVLSNVIQDPSKGEPKVPTAKVAIESWSLALACGGALVK